MNIAVVGTGFIGGILGRALSRSGHVVTFGSRHPDRDDVAGDTNSTVASVPGALASADVVILAVPGQAVSELTATYGSMLGGKLVIDATNRMSEPEANCRSLLPPDVRYARAFNTLGGEVMEAPVFSAGRADMFFSAPVAEREVVEEVIRGVGLRPIYVGPDQEALIDGIFRLWVALAMGQRRGRHIALQLLED